MGSVWMQIFTIVTGLASLLGAVLAWQQRPGDATDAAVRVAREVVLKTLETLERCATEVSLRIGA